MCIRPFSHGSCNQLFYATRFFAESGSGCTVWSWDWDWSTSKFLGSSDPEFLTCISKDCRFSSSGTWEILNQGFTTGSLFCSCLTESWQIFLVQQPWEHIPSSIILSCRSYWDFSVSLSLHQNQGGWKSHHNTFPGSPKNTYDLGRGPASLLQHYFCSSKIKKKTKNTPNVDI